VSAIARFQMKPVMAFFICGNTLLFFLSCFLNLLLRKREEFSGKIQQVCADQKCSGSTDDSRENKTL